MKGSASFRKVEGNSSRTVSAEYIGYVYVQKNGKRISLIAPSAGNKEMFCVNHEKGGNYKWKANHAYGPSMFAYFDKCKSVGGTIETFQELKGKGGGTYSVKKCD